MKVILSLTPLRNALKRLEEGLARYERNVEDDQIRDGLIQRFEFTYEQAHKMLRRYLELVSPSPDLYDAMPFPDLIRSGNEQGLLQGDWSHWKIYREMRGKTSHTYDERIALEVVKSIPEFLAEARFLAAALSERVA